MSAAAYRPARSWRWWIRSRLSHEQNKARTTMKKGTITMKKTKSGSKERLGGSPSQLIDARIKELSDWRAETLARIRMLIKQADLEVVEEVKWRKPSNSMLGVPVWSHAGMI